MAKLCRHHQKRFMSVLSHIHSEAGPESESTAGEDMAASAPAPQQQLPYAAGSPARSRASFQSRPSFNQAASTQSELNCENGAEDEGKPSEGSRLAGSKVCGATSDSPAPFSSGCSGGTLLRSSTVGARSSSTSVFTTNCNKAGSLEAFQKETLNQKLISSSPLCLPSNECELNSSANRTERASSCNQKNKTGGKVSATSQKQSLQALPIQILNLRKNLSKSQNGLQDGAISDNKAIKGGPAHEGPHENATTTKKMVKGNHVLPTTESAKDCWDLSKSRPTGRGANGRLRLKVQSPSITTIRKSSRVTFPRLRSSVSTVCQYVNEHDNQCDIVYISKPITECRFDTQRSWNSKRKTARKSTRGHLCNEEYWELKTVRTSAKGPAAEARKESLASIPKLPNPVMQKAGFTLPVSVPVVDVPVTIDAGNHEPMRQEKSLLKQDQVWEVGESLNSNCSANDAGQPTEEDQACQMQETSASSVNSNRPQEEQKQSSGQAGSPSSNKCPIRIIPVPKAYVSKCISTRTVSQDLDVNMSVEPHTQEECKNTGQSLSRLEQLGTIERDKVKCNSSAEDKSSPNYPEPNLNNGSQDSLDNVEISPVNNVEINLPPWKQSSNKNNNRNEILNVGLGELSHSPCKPTEESQQPEHSNKSFENVEKVMIDMLINEKAEPRGLEVMPCFQPKLVSCSVPKGNMHPQPASMHEGKSRRRNPAELVPERVEGPGQGPNTIECHVTTRSLCPSVRKLEVLDSKVPGHSKKEGILLIRSLKPGSNISPYKKVTSIPLASEKKRQCKKPIPNSSDRCLRSQQSQPQNVASPGDIKEICANALLVPCLNVNLLMNQNERGCKREVCISRVATVQFPLDCFNKTLLQSIADPESRVDESLAAAIVKDTDKMRKSAAKQVVRDLPAKELESSDEEELVNHRLIYEKTVLKQGRILKVCLDAKSDEERHVSFTVQNTKTHPVSEYSCASLGDLSTASQQHSALCKTDVYKENIKRTSGGLTKKVSNLGSLHQATKGMLLVDKKAGSGSRDLRSLNIKFEAGLEEETEHRNKKPLTEVLPQDEESDRVGVNDADATEVSRPKFLDWCLEDEHQELITTLNAKYECLHKTWIQMEKEGPVIQKAKSKSDRLKEIWRSRKRARKARGLYDHKISPVQKLFVANFSLANICKWFMETTETKSLVIVKNVSARNPLETLKAKTFLQKSSMAGLFPSPQAERLKKHLKKFAVASPAQNNLKTRALLDSVRRMALTGEEQVGQQQDLLLDTGGDLSPRDFFLAKVPAVQEEGDDPLSGRMAPQLSKHLGLKKPVSAWILRKYSNMMGKLHKLQHGKEQAVRKYPGKHKSVCMNPLVLPKLTSQAHLDSPRHPTLTGPRRAEENKGKRKGTREAIAKDSYSGRAKSSKSEAVSPALPYKFVPKQLPASRKPKTDTSSNKPPTPKKASNGGKSSGPAKALPRSAEKRSAAAGLKVVRRAKGRSKTRDVVKGKKVKVKAKRKGSDVGKERLTKPALRKAKRQNKIGTRIRNKAMTPAKHRPKCEITFEAKHKKKRKLSEKSDPVPNKRKRTDVK
ncbi:uncharacterized protein [Narcine bancroftii]